MLLTKRGLISSYSLWIRNSGFTVSTSGTSCFSNSQQFRELANMALESKLKKNDCDHTDCKNQFSPVVSQKIKINLTQLINMQPILVYFSKYLNKKRNDFQRTEKSYRSIKKEQAKDVLFLLKCFYHKLNIFFKKKSQLSLKNKIYFFYVRGFFYSYSNKAGLIIIIIITLRSELTK